MQWATHLALNQEMGDRGLPPERCTPTGWPVAQKHDNGLWRRRKRAAFALAQWESTGLSIRVLWVRVPHASPCAYGLRPAGRRSTRVVYGTTQGRAKPQRSVRVWPRVRICNADLAVAQWTQSTALRRQGPSVRIGPARRVGIDHPRSGRFRPWGHVASKAIGTGNRGSSILQPSTHDTNLASIG